MADVMKEIAKIKRQKKSTLEIYSSKHRSVIQSKKWPCDLFARWYLLEYKKEHFIRDVFNVLVMYRYTISCVFDHWSYFMSQTLFTKTIPLPTSQYVQSLHLPCCTCDCDINADKFGDGGVERFIACCVKCNLPFLTIFKHVPDRLQRWTDLFCRLVMEELERFKQQNSSAMKC